jgi:hypothetical protein
MADACPRLSGFRVCGEKIDAPAMLSEGRAVVFRRTPVLVCRRFPDYQRIGIRATSLNERRLGEIRLFVNGENLTNVRQTRWDPLLRPTRAADGRWTVDAWAPLEGININGGIRVQF